MDIECIIYYVNGDVDQRPSICVDHLIENGYPLITLIYIWYAANMPFEI